MWANKSFVLLLFYFSEIYIFTKTENKHKHGIEQKGIRLGIVQNRTLQKRQKFYTRKIKNFNRMTRIGAK